MINNTLYYGGDILNLINKTLACRPVLDRGGIYIWVVGQKIIYCDLKENNYRGCLEVYESGQFKGQVDYHGILTVNDEYTDYMLTEERKLEIVSFLVRHCMTTKTGVINLDITVKKEGE